MLIFLFIKRDDFIKIELISPVRLKHIREQRAVGKSLHHIVWRIAEYAPYNRHGSFAHFYERVVPSIMGRSEESKPKAGAC